jgi:hypothetical protein
MYGNFAVGDHGRSAGCAGSIEEVLGVPSWLATVWLERPVGR